MVVKEMTVKVCVKQVRTIDEIGLITSFPLCSSSLSHDYFYFYNPFPIIFTVHFKTL